MMEYTFQGLFKAPGDRIVCYKENEPVYLKDLFSRVSALHSILKSQPGQNWVLSSESSFNFLTGFLALIVSGKEILLPPNNLAGTINETLVGAEALLTDIEIITTLPKFNLIQQANFIEQNDMDIDVTQSFVQICTSGSTGEPKQIRKSLATLESEIQSLQNQWGEALVDKTVVSTVSHQHIYGLLFRVLWPLLSDRVFIEENVEYPEQIEALAKRYGSLVLISSPAYLKRMADVLTMDAMQNVKIIYSSGGPLARETSLHYAADFAVSPIEVLGSTETGGIAYRQQQAESDVAWRRFHEVQIRRHNESGALAVQSPFCFTSDWYEMGDAVELLDEAHFKLLGRIDRIVKLEEKRISLDRMEGTLAKSSLVEQAKVLTLEGYRTILGAVCVLTEAGQDYLDKQGRRALSNQLRDELAAYFDRVTLPRKWRYIPDFPYNAQGKITLADLTALFEEESGERHD